MTVIKRWECPQHGNTLTDVREDMRRFCVPHARYIEAVEVEYVRADLHAGTVIERDGRSWTLAVCPICGASSVDPEDYVCTCACALERVEVVPASNLRGAVAALKEIAGLKRAMETGPFPRSWGASDASKAVRLAEEALDRLGGR